MWRQVQDRFSWSQLSRQVSHHRKIHQKDFWYQQNSIYLTIQETVGVDFIMKNVVFEGAVYKLQLWDTAGQEKFKSLVPSYLRDAHCAVFVYDTSNKNTFF